LSSFRYIETEEGALETQFQALEIATVTLANKDEEDVLATQFKALKITTAAQTIQKPKGSITSWRSLKKDMEEGALEGWRRLVFPLRRRTFWVWVISRLRGNRRFMTILLPLRTFLKALGSGQVTRSTCWRIKKPVKEAIIG
jgi:hypothetical protein